MENEGKNVTALQIEAFKHCTYELLRAHLWRTERTERYDSHTARYSGIISHL